MEGEHHLHSHLFSGFTLISVLSGIASQLHTYIFIAPVVKNAEETSEAGTEMETKPDSNPDLVELSKLCSEDSPADKQMDPASSSGGQGENLSCMLKI